MRAANRVIFNTGITYARAVVTSLISLYSTRLVLDALGAEDFGIYNVVGGLIAMLSFLNAAMTTSTQRFISFNLGKGAIENVKKVFANSVVIHFAIGILLVILIEVVGLYFIENQLQINPDRIEAARYILHFVAASTFITTISVPYDAVINAHENMTFLAITSVIESVLKLLIALSILYLEGDRLIYYGLFMMFSAIAIRLIKRIYSRRKYAECHVSVRDEYNASQVRELASFAGWQLFGTLCYIGRTQGVAVVLNLFYGTVINAAYGIASQLNGQIMFFSQTMMSALRPQIMKSEGANDRDRMIRLALTGNRFAFYLFTFFALPLFLEMPFVLNLWLTEVPESSVAFCRAIILLTMMNQINMGLITAVQAIGKIKVYQMVAGGIQLLTLPIGYFLLKAGYAPYSIILVSVVLEAISTIFRVFYFKHLTSFSISVYFKQVILNSFLSLSPVAVTVWYVQQQIGNPGWSFVTVCLLSAMLYVISIYFIGLTTGDRHMVGSLRGSIKNRLGRK